MGIQGLLPLLKSIHVTTHISDFSGQRLAVDGYVWLHRGAYACAPQLVKGELTTKYVEYVMYRVRMLRHHGIEPYLVFDGGPLPAKKGTESERAKKRAENLSRANALAEQGLHSQARELYTKCVDVTPEMAAQVIKALKAEGVSYVVAPYEADAQLAFLEQNGHVDGIITEDSDLLVFGCKNVIFKLDSDGHCVNIKRDRFGAVADASMVGWSDKEFRHMAILSGCDYLPSIPGLGLKTAHKLLRKYKTVEKVLQFIRLESTLKIPPGYLAAFRTAELPFLHQRVFDPVSQIIVPLNPVDDQWNETKDHYVGHDIDVEIARGIAGGTVHPETLLPMDDINPKYSPKASSKKPLTDKNTTNTTSSNTTLKSFFSVMPKSRPLKSVAPIPVASKTYNPPSNVGASSGTRTLSAQMDNDRQLQQERESSRRQSLPSTTAGTTSKYFPLKRKREEHGAVPSTPRSSQRRRQTPPTAGKENEVPDPVEQDEAYRSPSGSSIVEVSSPIERLSIVDNTMGRQPPDSIISISPSRRITPGPMAGFPSELLLPESLTAASTGERRAVVLAFATPSPSKKSAPFSVDLGGLFRDPQYSDDGEGSDPGLGDTSCETAASQTPDPIEWDDKVDFHVDVDICCAGEADLEITLEALDEGSGSSAQKVMQGWRNQWSHTGQQGGNRKSTMPKIPMPVNVQDDTFNTAATATSSPAVSLQFTQSPSMASATKFKRRRPLAAQPVPRKSLGNDARSRPAVLNQGRRGRQSLDSGSDAALANPSGLSQKLQSFRYLPLA